MRQTIVAQALRPVIETLDWLDADHYITGSLATSFHGIGRSTLDVDLVAALDEAHLSRFIVRLESGFCVDEEMIREAIRERGSFTLVHLESLFKVDVFLPRLREFDVQVFARTVQGRIPGDDRPFPFASAEDVVLFKLEWFESNPDEKHWQDVIGVIRMQARALDREYLERWAREIGVGELLSRALRDLEMSAEC